MTTYRHTVVNYLSELGIFFPAEITGTEGASHTRSVCALLEEHSLVLWVGILRVWDSFSLTQ